MNMTKKIEIPIIIPSYEPSPNMLSLIYELLNRFPNIMIVVVNDGSDDSYKQYYNEAEKMGCVVLQHYENMGKGRALKDAFNFCLLEFPQLIGCVTADSDGQHLTDDIINVMNNLADNPDKLILGCREFESKNIPFKSKFGNKLTSTICHLFIGLKISDTQTGLRGIPKTFMAELLNTRGERFEFEMEMLLKAKGKWKIQEVSIETVYESKTNHITHFNPIIDSLKIYSIFGLMFVKYFISSISSSVIDLWLFNLLVGLLNSRVSYIVIATVIARVISATYNFTINRMLVFKSRVRKRQAVVKYILLAIIQMFCSALFVTIGCVVFGDIKEIIVKIIVDCILFFISFILQREIVFKE